MKLSEFGRRPQKAPQRRSAKEGEAVRRLEQGSERLRAALGLGWRAHAKEGDRREEAARWECADLSVQSQAARALLGYAECFTAQHHYVEKDPAWRHKLQASLVDAVAALETLLGSSSCAVRYKAAATAALLAGHGGSQWSQLAPPRLLGPLAALLDDSDGSSVCSAAKALEQTLSKIRAKDRSPTGMPGEQANKQELAMWQSLAEANPLSRIQRQLAKCQRGARIGPEANGPITAAVLTALEALVERWPAARQAVRGSTIWCQLVAQQCQEEDDEAAAAAFACAAALAADPESAHVLVHGCPRLWHALAERLQPSERAAGREQALRLLAQLPGASSFAAALRGRDVSPLARGCVQALTPSAEPRASQNAPNGRQLSSSDALRLQGLRAVCAILRWPGQHHKSFLEAGLLGALVEVLRGKGGGGGKDERQNPKVRVLAWQALSWVGAFSPGAGTKDGTKQAAQFGSVPSMLSGAFLGIMHRRALPAIIKPELPLPEDSLTSSSGTSPSVPVETDPSTALLPPGHVASPQEVVEICRAALAFVASRDPSLSARSQAALSLALKLHGSDWLASLVRQVAAYRDMGAKPTPADDQARVSRLLGVAALATCSAAIGHLLEAEVSEVLMRTIRDRAALVLGSEEGAASGIHDEVAGYDWSERSRCDADWAKSAGTDAGRVPPSQAVEFFGRPVEDWEGRDPILFAALAAFVEVLRSRAGSLPSSSEMPTVHKSLDQRLITSHLPSQPMAQRCTTQTRRPLCAVDDKLFLDLVTEACSPGVHWLAAQVRAMGVGAAGFPSAVGESMRSAFDNASSADVTFLFASGQRLHVHRAVLACCSPTLLSAFSSRVGRPEPALGPLTEAYSSEPVPSLPAPPTPILAQAPAEGSSPGATGEIYSRCAGEPSEIQVSPGERSRLIADGTTTPSVCHPAGEPLKVQVSPRVSFSAFRALLEFVYTGVVSIADEDRADVALLARKCGARPLADLLQGQRPQWGSPPRPTDLSAGLTAAGWALSDAVLYTRNSDLPPGTPTEASCGVGGPHLHAHRVVLGARCAYLEALFRSGMRDSVSGQVLVPDVSIAAVGTLLHFLYSGRLSFSPIPQPCHSQQHDASEPDAMHRPPPSSPPLHQCLSIALELASLSEQWMMEDLQEACWMYVSSRLSRDTGLHVLREGARWRQWDVVHVAVQWVAPLYGELRDRGLLEGLGEELQEAVRLAHVKLWRAAY